MTNVIDTSIDQVIVIIDDVEYPLAENTIETREKLNACYKATAGKARHERQFAELEVLLGKTACKKIFSNGKKENLDRLYKIHSGVIMAFQANHFAVDNDAAETNMATLNEQIAPMNRLLENALKFQTEKK